MKTAGVHKSERTSHIRNPALSKADYELLAEFRWHLRQFLHFSENAARSAGVSPQQHQALLAIKGFPGRDGIHIGQLAERLQIRHHSAVGLVDRLEKRGYVRRAADPRDRRRVELALTREGELVLQKLTELHRHQVRQVAPHLDRVLKHLVA